jgi:hypothetical protein
MAFNVRLHGYQGIVAMKVTNESGQQHSDSVYQLQQPPVWAQTVSVTAAAAPLVTPVTVLAPFVGDVSGVLRIEVPDGQAIRYEINPPNVSRTAGSTSPKMSGVDQFQWGSGWSISLVDASGLA